MVVLGVGTVGVLALLGVDAPELLQDCWWSGELAVEGVNLGFEKAVFCGEVL